MKYYLGIDGGGTKTTATIADENGTIISKTVGKTINFYAVGMDTARNNLSALIKETGIGSFEAAFIGCSALDSRADSETLNALCGGIINAEKICMDSDLYVALKSASGNAVAVCGTGSMAIGEKADGSLAVKGGWGHIIGDEGSAYSISVRALRLCCADCDKNVASPLLKIAEEYFGVDLFRKAIDVIYSPDTAKDKIAGFASMVGTLAENGNGEALEIVTSEAKAFAETVISLIKELDECRILTLCGGVFEHNAIFRNEFAKAVNLEFPQTEIRLTEIPPEEGALKAAMELK